VGFRAATIRQAAALGISGYVRNMRDGSVRIEAEGDIDQLDSFIAWCTNGPDQARIDRIVTKQLPLKGYKGFFLR